MALSNAERQRLYRERQRHKNLYTIKVKGEDGYFDERIRIAIAIKTMAQEGLLNETIIQRIIAHSIDAIPPKDLVDQQFIRQELENYLKGH